MRVIKLVKLLIICPRLIFIFKIEGLNGKGGDFLHKCIEEAKKFMKISMIDSTKTKWSELYEIRKILTDNYNLTNMKK